MKWVVDTKGEPGGSRFEISVVRDDFPHGRASYGWFGLQKILISSSGGTSFAPMLPIVWDRLVRVANEVAAELNGTDLDDI